MRVTIVGAGYVGLVTGVCLASRGLEVVCVDSDPQKVDAIQKAVPPIHETGLESLLQRTVGRSLIATSDLRDSVTNADVVMIAVGTPSTREGIDLAAVKNVAKQIGGAMRGRKLYQVIVVKSTVVPGTTDRVVLPILEETSGKQAGADFGVASNPEFLTEGQAIADFQEPDRIVIGGIDSRSIDTVSALYASFNDVEILRVNTRTAEMIKYASNAMLAAQISFSNELAGLASAVGGVDIVDVMRGVHLSNYLRPKANGDGRVMAPLTSFLEAGCGFGGSCLPKDVAALLAQGEQLGCDMSMLRAILHRNQAQSEEIVRLLRKHIDPLRGRNIAVLGLAFKPDTDDVRHSPAFPVIRGLLSEGARVRVYDPVASDQARRELGTADVSYKQSLRETLEHADGVAILTKWPEFLQVPEILKKLGSEAIVVDGRRMLDKRSVMIYEGIGLG
ncbi:MAG: UDP-glucose dehydrogenase family protein [Terriglobales bacterium]